MSTSEIVKLNDTQTLINKTIDYDSNTLSNVVGLNAIQTIINKNYSNSLFAGNVKEKATVQASGASGTIAFDVLSQQVLYYTSNSGGNWTINIRGSSSVTLNSIMNVGETITIAFITTNGSTAYYQTGFQIDGTAVTPKWQSFAPSSGNQNAIDLYNYTVIKTGNNTWLALAARTKFA